MEQRVRDILQAAFPGIEVLIEPLPDGRITGSLVSADFAGLDEVARQEKVRAALEKELGADIQRIGVLLTFTPDELAAMKAA